MFDTLPLKKEKRPLSEAVQGNIALSGPVAPSDERAAFFDAYAHQSFQQVRTRFLISSPLTQVGRRKTPQTGSAKPSLWKKLFGKER